MIRSPLQQARALAKAGRYAEAIKILERQPASVERDRLLKLVQKRQYIETGQGENTIPPIPEEVVEETVEPVAPFTESVASRRRKILHGDPPSYLGLRFMSQMFQFFAVMGVSLSALAACATIVSSSSNYGRTDFSPAFLIFFGAISLAMTSFVLQVLVDIATHLWHIRHSLDD